MLAVLPGVPTAVVFALAGWAGLRVTTFLLLDAVGALAMTGRACRPPLTEGERHLTQRPEPVR